MRKVETKFGDIYVDNLDDHTREQGRVKFYDSECKYLDYISDEALSSMAELHNMSVSEYYYQMLDVIKAFAKISDFLDYIGVPYVATSTDVEFFSDLVGVDKENLLDNEWVNKIGKWWILIEES